MWPQLRSSLASKTHLILLIWSAQQRALRRNETSPVSMTVLFGSSLEAPIFSTSLWKEGLRPATREFSKMLFNPAIDSSVVGFNANSNLFWAHSDQHLGKHPYFEGIVVLSRLCWELREALHVDPTRAARQGRENSELQELLKDVESNCFARSQTYRSKMKSWVDFSESLSCSMLMMRS